jgi:GT2 family glycosyltransferase
MSVLVGITTRDRYEILPKAIRSALTQHYPALQVAVFNDNSTDSTQLIKREFPQISWEASIETKGYLFARNKLMGEAKALYFCSLDDDAWFLDDAALAKSIEYLNKHPDVAAVGFDILSPDNPHPNPEQEPVETNMFIGCGHVLRLEAIRAVGFYDPNPLFYGGEEKDLCLKLIDKGFKIISMTGVHVWHDKTLVARNQHAQHKSGICNDLVFFYRRSPLVFLFPGLFVKIIKHLKFSWQYDGGSLFKDGLSGVANFVTLFFSFKLKRAPVSIKAFRKYNHLNK